ncbi:MAG TPA: hypothetical protein VGN26_01180 [Armatimonadota bacterium]|jgi:hypothetical protein
MAEKATTKKSWQPGDRVRVVKRDATLADLKSQLYFDHFGDLTGTIRRLYDAEAWVEIDRESLSSSVLARHKSVEANMKSKWLDGLSEEAKRRLTDREKQFRLRYSVLVSTEDLVKGPAAPPQDPSVTERRRTESELTADELAYMASRAKPAGA